VCDDLDGGELSNRDLHALPCELATTIDILLRLAR
jgi:hypothetical protein